MQSSSRVLAVERLSEGGSPCSTSHEASAALKEFSRHRIAVELQFAPPPTYNTLPTTYRFSSFSMASTTSGESGFTGDSNRATTFPCRSTRNLVKFHLMSPATAGFARSVRY